MLEPPLCDFRCKKNKCRKSAGLRGESAFHRHIAKVTTYSNKSNPSTKIWAHFSLLVLLCCYRGESQYPAACLIFEGDCCAVCLTWWNCDAEKSSRKWAGQMGKQYRHCFSLSGWNKVLNNGRFCVLLELCIAFVYMTRLTPRCRAGGWIDRQVGSWGWSVGGFIGRLLRAVEKANTR